MHVMVSEVQAAQNRQVLGDPRFQVAKAALQGMLGGGWTLSPDDRVERAVMYADKLLALLEKTADGKKT